MAMVLNLHTGFWTHILKHLVPALGVLEPLLVHRDGPGREPGPGAGWLPHSGQARLSLDKKKPLYL